MLTWAYNNLPNHLLPGTEHIDRFLHRMNGLKRGINKLCLSYDGTTCEMLISPLVYIYVYNTSWKIRNHLPIKVVPRIPQIPSMTIQAASPILLVPYAPAHIGREKRAGTYLLIQLIDSIYGIHHEVGQSNGQRATHRFIPNKKERKRKEQAHSKEAAAEPRNTASYLRLLGLYSRPHHATQHSPIKKVTQRDESGTDRGSARTPEPHDQEWTTNLRHAFRLRLMHEFTTQSLSPRRSYFSLRSPPGSSKLAWGGYFSDLNFDLSLVWKTVI